MTKEIIEFLDKYPAFLATKGNCGNPRVRPFQSPLFIQDKLFFCTSKNKNLYKHICNHNGVELSAYNQEDTWIRIRGNAVFSDSMDVKRAMFEKYDILEGLYGTYENPDFVVFYLDNISINIRDFNGRNETIKG